LGLLVVLLKIARAIGLVITYSILTIFFGFFYLLYKGVLLIFYGEKDDSYYHS
jgi:hypothetical protein